jgi:hypothetical protein
MIAGMVILLVWSVGWVFAIYPIYAALMRTHTANVAAENKRRDYFASAVTQGDVMQAIAGATALAAFWFLAFPYFLSHLLFNRHKPQFEREIESFDVEFKQKTELKRRLAHARKELEVEFKDSLDDDWRYRGVG